MFLAITGSFVNLSAQQAPATSTISADSLAKGQNDLEKSVLDLKKLRVTGWIQAQFQYAQTRGVANFDGGNFAPNSDKRFMIRRGRVKFTYNGKNSQYVMQINGTERGLNLVEIFGVVSDPWTNMFSLTVGIMNRPFGFEIDQSSAVRETPERSRYSQILMPNERDMGAKITVEPGKGKKLYGFRLDAGFYNGQGIYVPGTTTPAGYPPGTTPVLGVNEFDFQKDFIGRLCYYKDVSTKVRLGLGVSHYNGGNMYQNNRVYNNITTNAAGVKDWKMADTTNTAFKNKTSPRIYYGAEGFFSVKTPLGTTTLRGEYVTGTQSGTGGNSSSPIFLPPTPDTYVRHFNGMYGYFIQRLGESKHEVAVKYEWYDPNTDVTGADILGSAENSFTAADIRYTQLGFGYNYYMYENVKFMFFYNIIQNEIAGKGTSGLAGFNEDIKDNILTVRMQYRF